MASIYTFNSYLNCLPMTMDGTYKLYPSKYIALSGGSYEEVVNSFNNYLENNLDKTDERFFEIQRVLPYCMDNSGNPIKNNEGYIESILSDPNDNDGNYQPQIINKDYMSLGTIICGGDINFLNHDDSAFETIVYVSQSDMQAYTYITSFSEISLPLEDTIFVDTTGITKDVDTTKFDAIMVFFNVYRKVGESIDEDNDIYLRDMPALILDIGDTIELDSEKEWLTRIVMSLSNDGTIEVKTITDDEVEDINKSLQLLADSKDALDEEASKDYTDLDEVRSYYDYFKDNRQTNVPYIQGDWWFVNGKKAGLYKNTEGEYGILQNLINDMNSLNGTFEILKNDFNSILSILSGETYITNDKLIEILEKYETIEAHDEDKTNLKASIEDDIKKYVDNYINNDVLKLTVASDSKEYLSIDDNYQISFYDDEILEYVKNFLTNNISDYIGSGYVGIGEFTDKISEIDDTINNLISVATHSSWQRLNLTKKSSNPYYTLDFNPGHMSQTVVSDASSDDYSNNQWYVNLSYGCNPAAEDDVKEEYPNSITSQYYTGCTDSLFGTYETNKFLGSTKYHDKKSSITRIMCRDNTYKNYIPRAYMQVSPDVIDFIIDSHTEETSDNNTHPSIASHDTYGIHICFTKDGIYIGENLLSSNSSEGNMYINNSPILTLDNLEKLTGLSPS